MTVTVRMIEVPEEEYNRYYEAYQKLSCLEAAGVDNWDGYDFAMEEFHKSE